MDCNKVYRQPETVSGCLKPIGQLNHSIVIPAQAGIHRCFRRAWNVQYWFGFNLDSRLRGNDGVIRKYMCFNVRGRG